MWALRVRTRLKQVGMNLAPQRRKALWRAYSRDLLTEALNRLDVRPKGAQYPVLLLTKLELGAGQTRGGRTTGTEVVNIHPEQGQTAEVEEARIVHLKRKRRDNGVEVKTILPVQGRSAWKVEAALPPEPLKV